MADESQEKRQQLDPVFKQVLEDELSPFHAALQTEVEVSRLPRTIDALITVVREDDLRRRLHARVSTTMNENGTVILSPCHPVILSFSQEV